MKLQKENRTSRERSKNSSRTENCRCAQKNLFDLPGPIPFHQNKVLIIKGTKAIRILIAHRDKFACKTDIKS